MFKKLLTLSAAAMVCASLHAEMVTDYVSNWQNDGWHFYEMGYAPEVIDGILVSEKPEDSGWYQYFVADQIQTVPGTTYYVTAKVKASEDVSFNLNMGWGWGDGEQVGRQLTVTTEWNEVELKYTDIEGTSCNLVAQPGGCAAKIEWEWVKVAHEDNAAPVEWKNVLTGGDAQGDGSPCFISKVYGGEMGEAPVEDVDGVRAYVVHATAKAENAWDNQFFITVPEEYAMEPGTPFKLKFRYMASKDAKVTTQAHRTAGNYMHWQAIGDVNFTTEWQDFSKTVVPSSEMEGARTIAFNLSEIDEANNYYFTDLEWCVEVEEENPEVPEDNLVYTSKWDTEGWHFYVMGYEPKVADGILVSENPLNEEGAPAWYQYFVADQIPTTVGSNYKVVAKIKASEDVTFGFNMGWGWGDGQILNNQISATTEWTEQEIVFTEIGGTSSNLIAQPGVSLAKIEWEWVKVYEQSGTTAVSTIEIEDAPAVYYNMQGMQIANPVSGQIYIVKKGNKVTKTIIR